MIWITDWLDERYLEWPRLDAGLGDGDISLGEEYGETEEPAACICPFNKLLLCSVGDLEKKKKVMLS